MLGQEHERVAVQTNKEVLRHLKHLIKILKSILKRAGTQWIEDKFGAMCSRVSDPVMSRAAAFHTICHGQRDGCCIQRVAIIEARCYESTSDSQDHCRLNKVWFCSAVFAGKTN